MTRHLSFDRSSAQTVLITFCALLLCGGCSHYVTPGRGADMGAFGVTPAAKANLTDAPIRESLAKKPLAAFPTGIAVARVQDSGYQSRTAQGWGIGRYSIVTTRDVEKPEQYDRLEMLPMVRGVAPINRLLLPKQLESDMQLRQAAATLHADVLLIYTLDTTFNVHDMATPLTVISLGLSPNQQARVTCTASAVLMDTRNGYLYGTAEATEQSDQLASPWTSEDAVDDSRKRAESRAFEKLVGEIEHTWRGVVREYARPDAVKDASIAPAAQTQ